MALLGILWSAVAACAAEGPPSAPRPASPETPAWPPAALPVRSVEPRAWLEGDLVAEPLAAEPFELTVLDPGTPPRAPLRYPTPPSALTRRVLSMRVDQSIGFEGTTTMQAGVAPWTVPIAVDAPASGHVFTYHLGDAGAAEPPPNGATELLGDFAAHDGHFELDERGRTPAGQVPVFSQRVYEAPDTMRFADGLFALWWPVFPEEPVGTGARWRVVDRTAILGIDVARTRTFTVIGGAPGTRRLHAEMSLVAGEQRQLVYYRAHVVPGGIARLEATVTADLELDPASPLPRRADATFRLELAAHPSVQPGAAKMKPTTIILSGQLR